MSLRRRDLIRLVAGAAVAARAQSPTVEGAKRNMIVRSTRPEDFEMPLDGVSEWITPLDRFYVRSHHSTPRVDAAAWRLRIDGEVASPLTLSLNDVRSMRAAEHVAVMECAGNGRALYEPPVRGVQWVYGAVGNARWRGVRLRDVLERAGVKPEAKHAVLNGADVPLGAQPDFRRSVPLARAMHPDTLLAYEMNGAPLAPSHGAPLRLVVPGWAGDSWVKWVTNLTLSPREAEGFYMQTAYRHPRRPVLPGKVVAAEAMVPVEALAVKSVIATPIDGDVIPSGAVRIAGTAWSGEAPVERVEVSVDRGRSWQNAALGRDQSKYAWRLWTFEWTPREAAHYVVMARAVDQAGRVQPLVQEWNPSGYLYNAVQQVAIDYGSPKPQPVPAATRTVPPGAQGRFLPPRAFKPACLTCHEEDIIMQQRLTRAQWDDEVARMEKWGARVSPAARESIIDYLYRLYGPRPRT